MNNKPDWEPLSEPLDVAVYSFLTDYYLYQDQLLWSRVHTGLFAEAALLAGAIVVAKTNVALGQIVLIAGIFFNLVLWGLVRKDRIVRDQSLSVLDKVHEPRGIRVITGTKYWWEKGHILCQIIFGLMILFNLLAIIFLPW